MISSGQTATADVPHSETFWFHYGDIVFEAQSVRYRVHRDIMGKHSTVFREMFSGDLSSDTPDQPQTSDGCPIVVMDDAKTDLELLLNIIYEPLKTHSIIKALSLEQIFGLLRITEKYQFDAIREVIDERLSSEFPNSLDEFVALYTPHLAHKGQGVCGCGLLACSPENLIKIMHYAIDPGSKCSANILPIAYFLTSGLSISMILTGIANAEGGSLMPLSPALQEKILQGQRALEAKIATVAFRWLFDYSTGAKPLCSSGLCSYPLDQSARKTLDSMMKHRDVWRVALLDATHEDSWGKIDMSFLCSLCRGKFPGYYDATRRQIWDSLPGIFDLPAWDGPATPGPI